MFGLFKKKYKFSCSFCGAKYEVKLNTKDYTDFNNVEFAGGRSLVETQTCEFCKAEMVTTLNKKGELEVWDEKWEILDFEHNKKLLAIDEEVSELEEKLGDNSDDSKLQKAIDKLAAQQEKLEDSHERKEEKYLDRAEKWQEKWDAKWEKHNK
jgi:hypothetical protein